jgi:hypothetical protein
MAISKSVIFRLRLPNGLLHRVEVGDDVSSLSDIHKLLLRKGLISADDDVVKIRGVDYKWLDDGRTDINSLNLKSGEILSVIGCISNSSKLNKSSAKSEIFHDSSRRKKAMTVADLEEYKRTLTKLKAQKSSRSTVVYVDESSQKSFNRMAKFGGFSLLLGKIISHKPSSRTRLQTRKVTRNNLVEHSQIIHVVSVCEISTGFDSMMTCSMEDHLMKSIFEIAESFDLELLGFCFGIKNEEQGVTLSNSQLRLGLQLQNITNSNNITLLRLDIRVI